MSLETQVKEQIINPQLDKILPIGDLKYQFWDILPDWQIGMQILMIWSWTKSLKFKTQQLSNTDGKHYNFSVNWPSFPFRSSICHVRLFFCLSVCLCHPKTPSYKGRIFFLSKVLAHLLNSDDTVIKKMVLISFFKALKFTWIVKKSTPQGFPKIVWRSLTPRFSHIISAL